MFGRHTFLFPGTSVLNTVLSMCSSSIFITCPYQFTRLFVLFLEAYVTLVVPHICSFIISLRHYVKLSQLKCNRNKSVVRWNITSILPPISRCLRTNQMTKLRQNNYCSSLNFEPFMFTDKKSYIITNYACVSPDRNSKKNVMERRGCLVC